MPEVRIRTRKSAKRDQNGLVFIDLMFLGILGDEMLINMQWVGLVRDRDKEIRYKKAWPRYSVYG
jgi:hypothetical protein